MGRPLRSTLLGGLLLVAMPLHAEEWKHEIAPYVLGAGLSGTSGIGGVVADVDVGFSDILSNLEFGFMGAYRGSKGPWSVMVDVIYVDLQADKTGRVNLLRSDVGVQQSVVEADVGYALNERFEVFGGLRYVDLQATLRVTGPLAPPRTARKGEDWIDPLVGIRYTWPIADAWSATLRGDVGGFGVGSDMAWQGVAAVRWQSSARVSWLLAYRYLDMDYEGDGDRALRYDMAMSGPALGVVLAF